jgi:hypothetical protein
MKYRLPFAALVLATALFSSAAIQAQTTINVNTSGTATATYDPFTANAGPFPNSNFGVAASASLGGTDIGLNLGGTTSFVLPAFTSGQILLPNTSNVNVGYTPGFTGSLSSTSNFTANASFVYNVGPFGGSDSLFSQNLNPTATANLVSGGSLVGGNGSQTANGNAFQYTYSASAFVASASATLTVGANYQNSVASAATTQYGVYSWLSTTPDAAPTTAPEFTSVSSGALNYTVQNFGETPGKQLYLNFEPGVAFVMAITPSSTLSTPITGNLSAEAFGDTLVNYTFPIATPFQLPVNYQEWDVSGDWNSGYAYSVPVMDENTSDIPGAVCLDPNQNCVQYVVDGNIFSFFNPLPTSGPSNLTGGSDFGLWNPTVNGTPPLPDACDPSTGICYASTDPNMPVGTGTVVSSVKPVGTVPTPEPGELPLLALGLAAILIASWRKLAPAGIAPGRV